MFDKVKGMVVHFGGIDLVAHQLCSTPADAEEHDSLCKWTAWQGISNIIKFAPAGISDT